MSKPAAAETLLKALERWQALVEERARDEGRVAADEQQRRAAERQRFAHAQRKQREEADRELAAGTADLEQRRAALERWAKGRAVRLRNAQRNARKSALDVVTAAEDRRKFELQRDMLRTAREREEGVGAAEGRRAAFVARAGELGGILGGTEAQFREFTSVYGKAAQRALEITPALGATEAALVEEELAEAAARGLGEAQGRLETFRRRLLPRLSRLWPVGLILLLSPILLVPVAEHFGVKGLGYREAGGAVGALAVLGLALHFLGRRLVWSEVRTLADGLGRVRAALQLAEAKSVVTHREEITRVQALHDARMTTYGASWEESLAGATRHRAAVPEEVDSRAARLTTRQEARVTQRRAALESQATAARQALEQRQAERVTATEQQFAEREAQIAREAEAERERIATRWVEGIGSVNAVLQDAADFLRREAPAWEKGDWEQWQSPTSPLTHVRLGALASELELALGGEHGALGTGAQPPSAGAAQVPLLLTFPEAGSLVLETDAAQRSEAIAVLNQVILRVLGSSPPGRAAFTVFDPVGLGENFAGLLHLADDAEHLIQGRVWTNPTAFEERLAELNDHVEKVIQMYLRNEYPTIAEYNAQAGNIAEKYHFLVIADFPVRLTDTALRRLASLCASGPRCGVYVLLHWNRATPLPTDFSLDEVRRAGVSLAWLPDRLVVNGRPFRRGRILLDRPPEAATATTFLQRVARANLDSHRVEVPFEQITPSPAERWSLDFSTELRVPIGRTGATKQQYFALGKGTRQHALIAGKTGSGKSTLFHVLITNLALWASPDEVEFYLVDFKKGVEFKAYAQHRLPHARVVAIESDRDFGLSVLQRVDEELKRRGDLFRGAGAQDLAGYRRASGGQRLPRVLLLIDEFQELFVEEDRTAQAASMLLDRIVRQGRAFGIHVVLGSQTLGGAYTVARTTLGQMVVRIALQCNEADAMLIMDESNPAPRLLSRPGEGIYNDAAGAKLGNSPFQVVWLPDRVRDQYLEEVRQEAERRNPQYRLPVVYEGDAPADIRENGELRALLAAPLAVTPPVVRWWLGAPNAIKGPTAVALDRRGSGGVLVVSQNEEAVAAMVSFALVALSAQYPRGGVRFVVLDGSAPDSPLRTVYDRLPQRLAVPVEIARPPEAAEVVKRLASEAKAAREAGSTESVETFLFIAGVQQFRGLRQDDEFEFSGGGDGPHPGALLKEMIAEGGAGGVHAVVAVDSYNNALRYLGRKALGECGVRILFQMSANDSASLMDNPAASRLGLHRAILFRERDAQYEVFRPYALPDEEWWEEGTQRARLAVEG